MLCLSAPYNVPSSGFGLAGRKWLGRNGSRTGKKHKTISPMKSEISSSVHNEKHTNARQLALIYKHKRKLKCNECRLGKAKRKCVFILLGIGVTSNYLSTFFNGVMFHFRQTHQLVYIQVRGKNISFRVQFACCVVLRCVVCIRSVRRDIYSKRFVDMT